MSYTIYGLRLNGDREVRYIGQTSNSPLSRLKCLTSEAKMYGRRPTEGFGGWLLDNQGTIEAFEIDRVETRAQANLREREIVSFCLCLNQRLFNHWLVPAELRICRSLDKAKAA